MATTATASPTKLKQTAEPEQAPAPAPKHDEIASLAYNYWLERQESGEGSPEEDWLRAEEELNAR